MSPQLLTRPEHSHLRRDDGEPTDPSDVLEALNDSDCRRILDATTTRSLTTREISEECDLPLSTTYRKVDLLTDAALLEERVRLCTSGKHPSEYRRSFDDVVVHLADDGDVEVDLARPSDLETADATASATW